VADKPSEHAERSWTEYPEFQWGKESLIKINITMMVTQVVKSTYQAGKRIPLKT
jgi:hypothetical protein